MKRSRETPITYKEKQQWGLLNSRQNCGPMGQRKETGNELRNSMGFEHIEADL